MIRGEALSSTVIHLQWNPPPDEHHNGEIDSYTVLCSDTGGSLTQFSTATTNITIDGLHPYYTYNCSVSAVTVDQGPFSAIVSVTTLEDGWSPFIIIFYTITFCITLYNNGFWCILLTLLLLLLSSIRVTQEPYSDWHWSRFHLCLLD